MSCWYYKISMNSYQWNIHIKQFRTHDNEIFTLEQGKSEGFDSCDRPSNLTQIGFKSSIFQPVWPWNLMDDPKKTIGHLFYATLSFLHHFVAIGEYKLELQSGNAQLGSKLTLFFSRVTLKFDGWPSKTIGHLVYATSSFVHHCSH